MTNIRYVLKCLFPIKGGACFNIAYIAYTAEKKAKFGGEESSSISAKRNTIMFEIFRKLTMVIKLSQTNLNLVWNLCLGNNFFVSKPNWNWFGKSNAFLGVSFPNQTGFGLKKDTE